MLRFVCKSGTKCLMWILTKKKSPAIVGRKIFGKGSKIIVPFNNTALIG